MWSAVAPSQDGDEEGPVNDDTPDNYEDKQRAAPQVRRLCLCTRGWCAVGGAREEQGVAMRPTRQAPEEELQLPDDMDLEAGGEAGEEGEEGQEAQEGPEGKEQDAAGKEEEAGGPGQEQEQEQAAAQEQGGEGGEEEKPGGEGEGAEEAGAEAMEEDGAGGVGEVQQPQEPGGEEPCAEEPEPMAVDDAGGDEAEAQQGAAQPEQEQQQLAGPRGVAARAPAGGQADQPRAAAHGAAPAGEKPPPAAQGADAAAPQEAQPQDAAAAAEAADLADAAAAPEAAPEASQSQAGRASAAERQPRKGALAPMGGGEQDAAAQVRAPGPSTPPAPHARPWGVCTRACRARVSHGGRAWVGWLSAAVRPPVRPHAPQADPQPRARSRPSEPNPLRNLGDALERWRANLAVQHEAPQREPGAAGGERQGFPVLGLAAPAVVACYGERVPCCVSCVAL